MNKEEDIRVEEGENGQPKSLQIFAETDPANLNKNDLNPNIVDKKI